MSYRLLGALEDLDEAVDVETEEQPTPPDDLDSTLLTVMDDESEFDESSDDVTDGVDSVLDKVDSSIEQLETLRDALVKHGISRSMMEVADPQGELVADGICPSYEGLSDVAVHDTQADAAIEGISDTLNSIWKRLSDFFGVIGTKLAKFAEKTKQLFMSYSKALAAVEKKMDVASVDAEKFAAKKIKCYGKVDFGSAVKVVDKIMRVVSAGSLEKAAEELENDLKNPNMTADQVGNIMKKVGAILKPLGSDDVKTFAGIDIKLEGAEFSSIGSVKVTSGPKRDTIGGLGWKPADVPKIMNQAQAVVNNYTVSVKHIETIVRLCKNAATALKNQAMKSRSASGEQKAAYKAVVMGTRKVILANRTIVMAELQCSKMIASTALQLGREVSK